jgi:Response regulator containing CheY-like receiver, AAA-type ATPase, and DNA-binding domains
MHHPDRQKTALILLPDTSIASVAQSTIQEMGHRCIVAQSQAEAEGFLRNQGADLLLSRFHDKARDFHLFDLAKNYSPNCRGIAIIDASLEDYFPELASRAYPYNLIADNQPVDLQELVSTLQKLISDDIFGIEKYNIPPQETLNLTQADQKYSLIDKVRNFFLQKAVQDRLVRNVELILNELLMNAVVDAPMEAGKVSEAHAEVRYGTNGEHLAVSVSDPYGSFNKETFFLFVHRCFAERSLLEYAGKGAGMGLFLVFKSLNQLVVNVAPGKKTEVIALIDPRLSMRELKRQHHSFHYFHLGTA